MAISDESGFYSGTFLTSLTRMGAAGCGSLAAKALDHQLVGCECKSQAHQVSTPGNTSEYRWLDVIYYVVT